MYQVVWDCEEEIPDYFIAQVSLKNESGETVVSEVFDENTHKYEEFAAKTVNDFEGKTVLSADGSIDNNFFVVSDDVEVIRNEGAFDIFVDETTEDITLKGDISGVELNNDTGKYIIIDDDNFINVTAEGIEQDGDTLVISQSNELTDEEKLEEFFDYIKVDSTCLDYEGASESDDASNSEPVESDDEEDEDEPSYVNVKSDYIKIFKWDTDPDDEKDEDTGITGTLDYHLEDFQSKGSANILFKIRHDVQVYGKKDLKLTFGIMLEGTFKFRIEQSEVSLKYSETLKSQATTLEYNITPVIQIPLANFIYSYIELKSVWEMKWSKELSGSVKIEYEHVFYYNEAAEPDKKQTSFNDFSVTPEIQSEAKFTMFIGFETDVGAAVGDILTDTRAISLGVEGKVGGTATAVIASDLTMPPAKSIHACTCCANLTLEPTVTLTFYFSVLKWKAEFPVEFKIGGEDCNIKLYCSMINDRDSVHEGKLHLGTDDCPNVLYSQKLYAQDETGKYYDVGVTGEYELSKGILASEKTRTKAYDGQLLIVDSFKNMGLLSDGVYYLYNGDYTVSATIGGTTYSRDFEVKKDNQEINILDYNITGLFSGYDTKTPLDVKIKIYPGGSNSLLRAFQTAPGTYQGKDDSEKLSYSCGVLDEYFIIPPDCSYLNVQIECDNYKTYTKKVLIPNTTGELDLGHIWMVNANSELDPSEVNEDEDVADTPVDNGMSDYSYLEPVEYTFSQSDKFTFTVDESNHTAAITGYSGSENYYIIPSTVSRVEKDTEGNSVKVKYTVTSIANQAFRGKTGIRMVKLPSTVKTIGECAFYDCTALENIFLNRVTSLGNHAFYGCTNVKTIDLGSSLKATGTYAFGNCKGATEICMPSCLTSVGADAFSNCSGLSEIELSGSLTSIGSWAFSGCSRLSKIELPDSVKSIGDSAFRYCSQMKSINISSGVESVGKCALVGCSSLEELTIDSNLLDTTGFAGNVLRNNSDDSVSIKKLTFGDIISNPSG